MNLHIAYLLNKLIFVILFKYFSKIDSLSDVFSKLTRYYFKINLKFINLLDNKIKLIFAGKMTLTQSSFIKNNLSSCLRIGLAIVGYLKDVSNVSRTVHFIGNKYNDIKKTEYVAQKNISEFQQNSISKSLINRLHNVEISPNKITLGQGEYIVFHLYNGKRKELTPALFETVYKILVEYSPMSLQNSKSNEDSVKVCANRYDLIREKIKSIDQTLEIIFVPRTLIELIFIRKCIKEDLRNNEICPFLDRQEQTYIYHPEKLRFYEIEAPEKRNENLEEIAKLKSKRKCWHVCYFDYAGDSEHPDVTNVAFRLNQAIVKTLNPSSSGFTYEEFSVYTEKEIEFLKGHYLKGFQEMEKIYHINIDKSNGCRVPGPTMNFGYELTRDKPMGIRNEDDAQIIRDAVALDCSKIASHSFMLYRGANLEKDRCFCWDNKNKPYSLSFGSSLFAGCLFDGGATAFHYMRNGKNAYVIPVPYDQLKDSPFYIPQANTYAQLFGDGEIFHSRTKAWKDFDLKKIGGINMGANKFQREHLSSSLNQNELITQFTEYKNNAIIIK